jgi:hypothetical protein
MKQHLFEGRFYETYYFSNVVRNVLHDQFSYLRNLDEFYGDDRYLAYVSPFSKWSAFHSFIAFLIDNLLHEEMDKIDLDNRRADLVRFAGIPSAIRDLKPTSLPINDALAYYRIEHTPFATWLSERSTDFNEADADDVYDYYQDLRLEGPLDSLVERATEEVFFVLFQNRGLLLIFNDMMARQVADANNDAIPEDLGSHFASPGMLRRARVPAWTKRAVYFRDRGFCALCRRDVSGSTNVSNLANYDHVVPLAQGGLNDVTNIQLLCEDCNLRKGDRRGCPESCRN